MCVFKYHAFIFYIRPPRWRCKTLLYTQGTFCIRPRGITLIESTQTWWFSRWSGGGGWSGRAIAQRRTWVSKLGLKGPSPTTIPMRWQSRRPGRGQGGRVKGLLSPGSTRRGELENSSRQPRGLIKLGQKGSPLEKCFTATMKELLTLSRGWWSRELLMTMRWWWVRIMDFCKRYFVYKKLDRFLGWN